MDFLSEAWSERRELMMVAGVTGLGGGEDGRNSGSGVDSTTAAVAPSAARSGLRGCRIGSVTGLGSSNLGGCESSFGSGEPGRVTAGVVATLALPLVIPTSGFLLFFFLVTIGPTSGAGAAGLSAFFS